MLFYIIAFLDPWRSTMSSIDSRLNMVETDSCPNFSSSTTDACSLDCLPSTSWGMDSKANFSWNLSDSNKGQRKNWRLNMWLCLWKIFLLQLWTVLLPGNIPNTWIFRNDLLRFTTGPNIKEVRRKRIWLERVSFTRASETKSLVSPAWWP